MFVNFNMHMSSIKRSLLALTIFICSSLYAQNTPRTIHVFVALCDNVHQGIVPVPKTLGNGEDPRNNLYWGALYGVKTFFRRSENWELISTIENPTAEIMERCIFKHQSGDVYLVADAYRGKEIRKTTDDFFQAAAGNNKEFISVEVDNEQINIVRAKRLLLIDDICILKFTNIHPNERWIIYY